MSPDTPVQFTKADIQLISKIEQRLDDLGKNIEEKLDEIANHTAEIQIGLGKCQHNCQEKRTIASDRLRVLESYVEDQKAADRQTAKIAAIVSGLITMLLIIANFVISIVWGKS